MSFKREGDDVDLLRSLKHRRVCELLSNHIPDDEALLLKNGRLTCLICSHRPIFDTLPMLAIHRKGKKHVNELSRYLLHKRESEIKKLKAEQTMFMRTGTVMEPIRHGSLPPTQQISNLLVTQVPYNKRRLGQARKITLDMHIIPKEADIPEIATKNNLLPSASAQVRRYLKGLWKKKPLEKTVEKSRENYGESLTQLKNETDCPVFRLERSEKLESRCSEENTIQKKKTEYEMKLRMNGWIKNEEDKWGSGSRCRI
ncbi:hypothetical protein L9F63_008196 [Diploptera punctata]|uniref:Sodium channel modifier 1 zinc-finger domain-containing protein n=1 Tax=Diploptera punctata TaxID=6984 RepID=A0AAD8E2U4_DIPPU|nr:hypothetical protein L9F63_008196 [Diploptera punctata]